MQLYTLATTFTPAHLVALDEILPASERAAMQSLVTTYLQHISDAFPQDYHPPPLSCLSEVPIDELSSKVEAFDARLDRLLEEQTDEHLGMTETAARQAAQGWVGAGDDIATAGCGGKGSGGPDGRDGGTDPELGMPSTATRGVELGDEAAASQLSLLQLALLRSGLRRLVGNLRLLHQTGEEVMDSMVRTGCC
jgi:hypothetical protein